MTFRKTLTAAALALTLPPAPALAVTQISSAQQYREILETKDLVLVDYHAAWNGPSRYISPLIDEMESQYPGVYFVRVDVDSADDIAESENIPAVPTIRLFRAGEQIGEVVGANDAAVRDMLERSR